MLVFPCLNVYSVTIENISWNSISVPINICLSKQTIETLIDSGTGGMFIDQTFTKNFEINYLNEPVKAYNIDRMKNKWGMISSVVNLKFKLGDQKFNEQFYVTGLGKQKIILGFPWLHKYNPIIDWKKREITWKLFQIDWRCLYKKGQRIRKEWQPKIEEVADEEETKSRMTSPLEEDKMEVYIKLLEANVWIHKTNIATELAIEENSKKIKKTDKELVPEEYHKYFQQRKGTLIPWNKTLGPQNWNEERIWTQIVQKLQSHPGRTKQTGQIPQREPWKRIHQTISVTYDVTLFLCFKKGWKTLTLSGLPVFEGLDDQKFLSTTIDLENYGQIEMCKILHQTGRTLGIQIRKGDEWKAAFKTNKGLFEPMVMFFGMCNSLENFKLWWTTSSWWWLTNN
jgi:hypothetical protein